MKNPPRRDIMKNMEQIKKNDIFESRIEGYNSEGSGVARILGRAVFVPRTIAGEVWRSRSAGAIFAAAGAACGT